MRYNILVIFNKTALRLLILYLLFFKQSMYKIFGLIFLNNTKLKMSLNGRKRNFTGSKAILNVNCSNKIYKTTYCFTQMLLMKVRRKSLFAKKCTYFL